MFPPTRRLNYFDHQFLRVDDFTDEQAYHLGMRRAHNRLLHAPGVAQGLAVTHAGSTLTVSAGVALDGDGREVVLKEPAELPVPPDAGGTAWVTIAYGERRIDPTTETGAAGDRRWEEAPALRLETAVPDDPETRLVLARVTLAAGRVTRIDDGAAPAHRRVAGPAPGAELEARSLAVQGSAAVGGTLDVEQTLSVGGTLLVEETLSAGELRVGPESGGLTVGVEVAGSTPGTARLRAEGAAERLALGAAGTDVLTVQPGRVGVGTDAPQVPLHVIGTRVRLQNAAGDKYLDMRTDGSELDLHAMGGALFVHTGLSGEALHLNAFGGNVGVGTGMVAATARLQVAGGNGDLGATEGDFKVGDDVHRLKVGVTTTGTDAGDVRVRAVGGTGRLMLGAGESDRISVTTDAIGFGTTAPSHPYHFVGPRNIALFESTGPEAFIRVYTNEGEQNRVEFCNRPGGLAAIFVAGAGDAVRVYRDGDVHIEHKLTVGSLIVEGRMYDARVRLEAVSTTHETISAVNNATAAAAIIPGMELRLESTGGLFLLRFHMGGVQIQGVKLGHADFWLMVDGVVQAYHQAEFHNSGHELRVVSLERLLTLPAGTHTINVQWKVRSPELNPAVTPQIRATLFGSYYNDTRTLMAIEL